VTASGPAPVSRGWPRPPGAPSGRAGPAAPEALRLLARAVIDPGRSRKADDATLMLVEWRNDRAGAQD
jgi:hypothetical protein